LRGSFAIAEGPRPSSALGDRLGKELMIDRNAMRSLLEGMEQAAEETLRESATFFEALQALKDEIDHDARVQEAVRELRAAGRSVFSSFMADSKFRVRTEEGIFALPKRPKILPAPSADPVEGLTQQLRSAASVVIRHSRYFRELEGIVNEAVSTSERFEGIAFEIESAGYEVLICLDLSAYVEVRGGDASARRGQTLPSPPPDTILPMPLTGADRKFLKGMGISTEGS